MLMLAASGDHWCLHCLEKIFDNHLILLLLMEWNGRPSLMWEWENLLEFDAKATENPKKLQVTDCSMEGDRGISSGSFHSPGDGGGSGGTGGSGSNLGHSSSKSSKSASINSSSVGDSKTSKFILESFEGFPKDFSNKVESAELEPPGSSTPEVSAGSVEPVLSLKLGKRMYFEDPCAGNNGKTSPLPAIPPSSATTAKRCKSTCQSTLLPRCQVEGCNLDLSSAKDYHRKHRICESHSKSPKVTVAGMERRFCQQCSRLIPLKTNGYISVYHNPALNLVCCCSQSLSITLA